MSDGCLKGDKRVSGGYHEGVYRMFKWCLKGVKMVSERQVRTGQVRKGIGQERSSQGKNKIVHSILSRINYVVGEWSEGCDDE